mmetsp:Transcript_91558/g.254981  ORF Transcript_91558/g.254981 Transcript_91558/m.254981 type:complete len:260 (-) Transcript_91558:30-809(-)
MLVVHVLHTLLDQFRYPTKAWAQQLRFGFRQLLRHTCEGRELARIPAEPKRYWDIGVLLLDLSQHSRPLLLHRCASEHTRLLASDEDATGVVAHRLWHAPQDGQPLCQTVDQPHHLGIAVFFHAERAHVLQLIELCSRFRQQHALRQRLQDGAPNIKLPLDIDCEVSRNLVGGPRGMHGAHRQVQHVPVPRRQVRAVLASTSLPPLASNELNHVGVHDVCMQAVGVGIGRCQVHVHVDRQAQFLSQRSRQLSCLWVPTM